MSINLRTKVGKRFYLFSPFLVAKLIIIEPCCAARVMTSMLSLQALLCDLKWLFI